MVNRVSLEVWFERVAAAERAGCSAQPTTSSAKPSSAATTGPGVGGRESVRNARPADGMPWRGQESGVGGRVKCRLTDGWLQAVPQTTIPRLNPPAPTS